MGKIKIFCEGITDQLFIADCLESFYSINFLRKFSEKGKDTKCEISFENQIEIKEIGGCDNLSKEIILNDLKDNTELGGRNVIIFDADYENKVNGNRGFKSCKSKLENLITRKEVVFDYYIWPTNQEDGIIEHLLEKLISPDKKMVYDCINNHQQCLKAIEIENVRMAELKEKIGFYLYTLYQDSTSSKRKYLDDEYWNLNPDEIEELKLLKTFLDQIFIQQAT